ncbi:hypothetical protein KM043_008169 [Ampulex compressa]|nr:hypothetical protein KM043_008169 [Ampulex compressa]
MCDLLSLPLPRPVREQTIVWLASRQSRTVLLAALLPPGGKKRRPSSSSHGLPERRSFSTRDNDTPFPEEDSSRARWRRRSGAGEEADRGRTSGFWMPRGELDEAR